jgi:protein-disulfide isomerase-like protein with CxxC motif
LEDGDFAEAATLLREGPPFLTARNDARVSLGRRLLAGVGAGGVPTLVVVRDEDRVVVPSGMLYGDPKPLIQALTDL